MDMIKAFKNSPISASLTGLIGFMPRIKYNVHDLIIDGTQRGQESTVHVGQKDIKLPESS